MESRRNGPQLSSRHDDDDACTSEFKHTPKIAFYSHGYLHTEITAVNKDPVGFLDQCHGGLGPDRHPHEKS